MFKEKFRKLVMFSVLVLFPVLVLAQNAKMASEATQIDQSELEPLTADQVKKLQDAEPLTAVSICKNQRVPSGYVIISEGSSISCPGNFPNTWNIKRPGQRETVCKVSPIPGNYVKQGEGSSISCPGRFPNTWHIRRI